LLNDATAEEASGLEWKCASKVNASHITSFSPPLCKTLYKSLEEPIYFCLPVRAKNFLRVGSGANMKLRILKLRGIFKQAKRLKNKSEKNLGKQQLRLLVNFLF